MYRRFINVFRSDMHVISTINMFESLLTNVGKSVLDYTFIATQESDLCTQQRRIPCIRRFSTGVRAQHLCTASSSPETLLKKLDSALRESNDEEALKVFNEYKNCYGFPGSCTVSKLITGLSYSSDHQLLHNVCNVVFKIAKEKYELLKHDSLCRLCLALARAQMSIPVSKLLRLMLQKNKVPTIDVLCSVYMHMVKTEAGTYLASNILVEICDCFHYLSARKSEHAMSLKPTTTMFNLVLDACVRFGSSLRGQYIIEVMARTGVVADANSVVLFSYIYEMNGQRDELKLLKEYVDRASVLLARHYSQFYDNLFSLHCKFDDLDAASSLVLDIYRLWSARPVKENQDLRKSCPVPIGSPYLKEVLKVQVMFELLQKDFVMLVKDKEALVIIENGKLIISSKGLAQLISKYKRSERIDELSKLLVAIEKEMGTSQEGSICNDVILACIYTGWLETAHDIMDDMEIATVSVPTRTYMLLLSSYCREKMSKEAEALAKQIKRAGLLLDASEEMTVSECLSGVVHGSSLSLPAPLTHRLADLTDHLVQATTREDEALSKVLKLNSSIYFFCRAKMLDDTRMAYRKLQALNIQPTVQTFAYMIEGFSSLKMYREITILWGDIKRYMNCGCSLASRDLYELLIMNFLRGGYFERVMEVLNHMKERSMCADSWLYKNEFLKYHKNLYQRLKAADAKNEAQRLRLKHVTAFRNWFRNN